MVTSHLRIFLCEEENSNREIEIRRGPLTYYRNIRAKREQRKCNSKISCSITEETLKTESEQLCHNSRRDKF